MEKYHKNEVVPIEKENERDENYKGENESIDSTCTHNNYHIPDFEIDSIARAMIPAIQKLFESEEIQKEFEEWKAKRQKEKNKTTLSKDDKKDAETDNLTIKT